MSYLDGLSFNYGNYYGSGSTYSTSGSSNYYGSSRSGRSSDISRVTRDITSGYNKNFYDIQYYSKIGNVNAALDEYNAVFEGVKSKITEQYGYDEMDDDQIRNIIENSYSNTMSNNQETHTLTGDISSKASSHPILTGIFANIPVVSGLFGWDKKLTKNEVVAKISGREIDEDTTRDKNIGRGVANIATAAKVGGIVFGLGKLNKNIIVSEAAGKSLKEAFKYYNAANKNIIFDALDTGEKCRCLASFAKKGVGTVVSHPAVLAAVAVGVAALCIISKYNSTHDKSKQETQNS